MSLNRERPNRGGKPLVSLGIKWRQGSARLGVVAPPSHGDLFARLIVEVPSRLNPEQRRKLEEFAELCGEENTPRRALRRGKHSNAQKFLRPREGIF